MLFKNWVLIYYSYSAQENKKSPKHFSLAGLFNAVIFFLIHEDGKDPCIFCFNN